MSTAAVWAPPDLLMGSMAMQLAVGTMLRLQMATATAVEMDIATMVGMVLMDIMQVSDFTHAFLPQLCNFGVWIELLCKEYRSSAVCCWGVSGVLICLLGSQIMSSIGPRTTIPGASSLCHALS